MKIQFMNALNTPIQTSFTIVAISLTEPDFTLGASK